MFYGPPCIKSFKQSFEVEIFVYINNKNTEEIMNTNVYLRRHENAYISKPFNVHANMYL